MRLSQASRWRVIMAWASLWQWRYTWLSLGGLWSRPNKFSDESTSIALDSWVQTQCVPPHSHVLPAMRRLYLFKPWAKTNTSSIRLILSAIFFFVQQQEKCYRKLVPRCCDVLDHVGLGLSEGTWKILAQWIKETLKYHKQRLKGRSGESLGKRQKK